MSDDGTTNHLRQRWADDEPVWGSWVSTTPLSAEIFAGAGYDYVCIDMQHGLVGYEIVVGSLQALRFSASTAIVRVPEHSFGWAGKALDAGAEGIIFPMVNTREQAEQVASYVRYAPEGERSYGPIRSGLTIGSDTVNANRHNLCIAMIETVEGVENADDICSTPGIDAIYIGPADLAVSMGNQPAGWIDDAEHRAAMHAVRDAGRRAGIPVGLHCPNGTVGKLMADEGFRMMTLVNDAPAITQVARAELAVVQGGEAAATGLYG